MKREELRLKKMLKKRTGLLKQLRTLGPMIDGSLVASERKCGNPNCSCATGKKHPTNILTYKPPRTHPGKPSKTKTLYVPVGLVQEVKKWSKECAKARYLIREVSDIQREIIRTHVAVKGRGKKK